MPPYKNKPKLGSLPQLNIRRAGCGEVQTVRRKWQPLLAT